jgi:hypothetical protein
MANGSVPTSCSPPLEDTATKPPLQPNAVTFAGPTGTPPAPWTHSILVHGLADGGSMTGGGLGKAVAVGLGVAAVAVALGVGAVSVGLAAVRDGDGVMLGARAGDPPGDAAAVQPTTAIAVRTLARSVASRAGARRLTMNPPTAVVISPSSRPAALGRVPIQ